MLEQSPSSSGLYGNIQFVFDDRVECDYVVVLNKLIEDKKVFCDPNNVWALMMEPSVNGYFDFTKYGHEQYGKVFKSKKVSDNSKYIASHIMSGWFTGGSYDTISATKVGNKEKLISCISSSKSFLPGHKKRIDFINKLRSSDLDIEFYGRDCNPIDQKWEGLYPYKYSIAIENSSSPDYWTEKLSDCFITYTIPIYYGCTNTLQYFPEGSILHININDVQESIEIIKNAIDENYFEKNLDALSKARTLYLEKYHFFPCIANHILQDLQNPCKKRSQLKNIRLRPYKNSFIRDVYNTCNNKLKKIIS